MKKPNFCAIFATMFVAATVIMLASCSQDDEFYEDGLFTRADGIMPRGPETRYERGSCMKEIAYEGLRIDFEVSWNSGMWVEIRPKVTYLGYRNAGGYQTYTDSLGIERKVPNIEYVTYLTESGPQIHFNKITIPDFRIYIRRAARIELGNGLYKYELGDTVPVLRDFEVNIPDNYIQ